MKKRNVDFPYAIKSFIGYLEGTQKSLHTIKNYRLDVLAFQDFMQNAAKPSSRGKSLNQIDASDLEAYAQHLKSLGLKNNTRRRKLMTLRKFLSYLAGRKNLPVDLGRGLPAPLKMERIPVTVSAAELLAAINKLPTETELDSRNRVLLWTLVETGCLISEVAKIRFDDWTPPVSTAEGKFGGLKFSGKGERQIQVTTGLYDALQELKRKRKGDSPWVFLGFNKFGSLGAAISPRGIELLVRAYADKLGFPDLVPRTLRHSIVLTWLKQGFTQEAIQKRLGLKSLYAFRAFRTAISADDSTNRSASE